MFKIVKRYYDMKIYSADDVGMFVKSGRLTIEQYKEITGTDYAV